MLNGGSAETGTYLEFSRFNPNKATARETISWFGSGVLFVAGVGLSIAGVGTENSLLAGAGMVTLVGNVLHSFRNANKVSRRIGKESLKGIIKRPENPLVDIDFEALADKFYKNKGLGIEILWHDTENHSVELVLPLPVAGKYITDSRSLDSLSDYLGLHDEERRPTGVVSFIATPREFEGHRLAVKYEGPTDERFSQLIEQIYYIKPESSA